MSGPRAPAVHRFETCQCPSADTDKCKAQLAEEVRDGHGAQVAVVCRRCTLPVHVICRACGNGWLSIEEHVKAFPSCANEQSYRMAKAHLNTAPGRRVGPGQKALFGDDVMKPKPKRMTRSAP